MRKHEAGKSTVIESEVAINAGFQKKDNEWPNVCPVASVSKLGDSTSIFNEHQMVFIDPYFLFSLPLNCSQKLRETDEF